MTAPTRIPLHPTIREVTDRIKVMIEGLAA